MINEQLPTLLKPVCLHTAIQCQVGHLRQHVEGSPINDTGFFDGHKNARQTTSGSIHDIGRLAGSTQDTGGLVWHAGGLSPARVCLAPKRVFYKLTEQFETSFVELSTSRTRNHSSQLNW